MWVRSLVVKQLPFKQLMQVRFLPDPPVFGRRGDLRLAYATLIFTGMTKLDLTNIKIKAKTALRSSQNEAWATQPAGRRTHQLKWETFLQQPLYIQLLCISGHRNFELVVLPT